MPRLSRKRIAAVLVVGLLVLGGVVWALVPGRSNRTAKASPSVSAGTHLPPAHAILSADGLIRQLPYLCSALQAGLPALAKSMELTFAYGQYSPAEMPGTGGAVYQTCGGRPPLDERYNRLLDANATQFRSVTIAKKIFRQRYNDVIHGERADRRTLKNVSGVGDESYAVREDSDGIEFDLRIRNVVAWIIWSGTSAPMQTSPPPDKNLSYQQAFQEGLPIAKALVQRCIA